MCVCVFVYNKLSSIFISVLNISNSRCKSR